MRRNNQGAEEPEEKSEWMTTYSDMVTLLLTFFVLLFAISNVDAKKFALLAAALSRDGITAERFMEIQAEHDQMIGVGEPDPDNIEYPGIDDTENAAKNAGGEGSSELLELSNLFINYVQENNLYDGISVIYNGDQILMTLTNDVWFASGSATITEEMSEKATAIAGMLRETHSEEDPFDIIVVGHTDNVPTNPRNYPSNWHLSVARAVSFLDILLIDSELSPIYFSVRGCGEWTPVASNDTPEGRQQNRRVEVLITQPKY